MTDTETAEPVASEALKPKHMSLGKALYLCFVVFPLTLVSIAAVMSVGFFKEATTLYYVPFYLLLPTSLPFVISWYLEFRKTWPLAGGTPAPSAILEEAPAEAVRPPYKRPAFILLCLMTTLVLVPLIWGGAGALFVIIFLSLMAAANPLHVILATLTAVGPSLVMLALGWSCYMSGKYKSALSIMIFMPFIAVLSVLCMFLVFVGGFHK